MSEITNPKELSEALGKISSDNEILLLLSNAIKYISDKLIDAEARISQEDEIKINMLLEKLKKMKGVFQDYAKFFEKNTSQITSLTQEKNDIELPSKNGYFYSVSLEITDFFASFQKDLLEVLSYTQDFFSLNQVTAEDKNSFGTLLDMIDKSKTKSQKIITLKNELTHIEAFISRLEAKFLQFHELTGKFQEKIEVIQKEYTHLFRMKTSSLFGDISTGNVAFLFQDNVLLTLLLEDIFKKIPTSHYGIKGFLNALLFLSGTKNVAMIRQKVLLSPGEYEDILQIFQVYQALYEVHFTLQKEIGALKQNLIQINSESAFILPSQLPEEEKELKIFTSASHKFLHDLKDIKLSSSQHLENIKIEKREVGNPELLKQKKEIFTQLFQLISDFSELSIEEKKGLEEELENVSLDDLNDKKKLKKMKSGSVFEKKLVQFFEIFQKYEIYKKDQKELSNISYHDTGDTQQSTSHYKPILNSYGVIQSFQEVRTDIVVAKTIGKTANEIRTKITTLLAQDKWSHILSTFPGESGSLEGNYIILGPWGGGKTALIKELSQDNRIATVEVGKSDIVDMYVGATEKNVKALYELSYEIHLQTKKHVFIFIDEVDALLSKITTTGGGGIDVQKEIQTMLDGVKSYPGVHTIMLSNKPHGIPIDIYRRMEKTFILQDLDIKEKVELIESRLGRYPMDEDIRVFLSSLEAYFPNINALMCSNFENTYIEALLSENNIEMIQILRQKDPDFLLDMYIKKSLGIIESKDGALIKRMYQVTPKILWQITEKMFKKFLSKFSEKDLEKLEKVFSKMEDKNDTKKVLKVFSKFPHTLNLDDFYQAMEEVFGSASIQSEIAGNKEFYLSVDEMMKKISSSAFDGVRRNSGESTLINLQITV